MSDKVQLAFDGLRRMISSGELGPGDRLPSEAELCRRFDVSRSSLREAQKKLAVAGVLFSRTGSGTFVTALEATDFMSGLKIAVPLLPLSRYLELMELRCALEGFAAGQAAARMSEPECHRLTDVCLELEDRPWDPEASALDDEFHALLISGCRNESIEALLAIIRSRGRHYRVFEGAPGNVLKTESDRAHRRIVQAITNHDPDTARTEASSHIRTTMSWLAGMHPSPEPE